MLPILYIHYASSKLEDLERLHMELSTKKPGVIYQKVFSRDGNAEGSSTIQLQHKQEEKSA